MVLIFFCWYFAKTDKKFMIQPANGTVMMISRFIASMFMHINVEKDVRNGIGMMKYASNHPENFTNVYPAFIIGLYLTINSFLVELNVMLILSSIPDVLNVIMKYVSLCAIAHLPRFYYSSLVQNKAVKFAQLQLPVTNFRHDGFLKYAHWSYKLMRYVYKSWRLFFCTVSYYFMPFMFILLNF